MTDLISRQDAIALLEAMYRASPWNVGLAEAVDAVTNMPSAESELQAEIADLRSQLDLWQYAAQYPRG